MIAIGLTGGVATGKSTVASLLGSLGATVFSADQASRAVLYPGCGVLAALASRFGAEYLLPDGQLDRAALAKLIFADSDARAHLNRITHPAILRLLYAQLESARWDLPGSIVVVEAPLLFEAEIASWFERIVVVVASEPTQMVRLMNRNRIDEAEARRRIQAQWPTSRKADLADYVISNDGNESQLKRTVADLWSNLQHLSALRTERAASEKNVLS